MIKYNLEWFIKSGISFAMIIGDRVVYKSKASGLKPLIHCIKKYKKQLGQAVIFDKVVGRAAAILIISAGINQIITPTISSSAIKIIKRYKIKVTYGRKVIKILNSNKTAPCPMEIWSKKNPEDFIRVLLDQKTI